MKFIKFFCVVLLTYTLIAGFLFDVPRLPILNETIRALYFHVPMWFTMIFLLLLSSFNSYRYINTGKNFSAIFLGKYRFNKYPYFFIHK